MHNFLIILVYEEKTSTSGIKVAVKNATHTAQNTAKIFRLGNALQRETLISKMPLLSNKPLRTFPVLFLHLRPR